MSIREVPMWRVECDRCGKGDESDYWAWASRDGALDEWVEGGNHAMTNGPVVHEMCMPWERCPVLSEDEGHTWESDGTCGEGCGRSVADVLAAAVGAV